MKYPNFKIRCSQIANIMSSPRSKKAQEAGELSQTTKSYVDTWLKEQIYGVKSTFTNKYVQKGIEMEDAAIELLAEFNRAFYIKNTEFFENDLITGTPDIITDDTILDTKCSWDCFKFPLFEEKLDPIYYWQMQGYMHLTGRKKAQVCYCLVDTPEHLRYEENDYIDYSQYPITKRVKVFDVDYDKDAITKVYTRVMQIREYIEEL